ncbi:type VI secretion system tip protein VgrG [Endozoicomonas sp. SM1973]|uniref:Type VI secretion system tip protein VgrG n=1 Tax=Spartinivicinus marinus TaxID=2994442 RepID=A0A853I8A9_9GAMM|nr:type VI secretion system tip protein VgrG [Spartinivicinus marinus]MCX4027692.1 type VI secretion system tip protein VgrG [Spartinivicinus marinus]NYZ69059.1 type VI secretion system tip protein VgrG [Spartinivicinus marinus]
MALTANESIFSIQVASLKDCRVVQFSGEEDMSGLFNFTVEVVSADKNIDGDELVGKPGLMVIQDPDSPRFIHGEIASFSHMYWGQKLTHYQLVLVPKFWFLQHRIGTRIFQNLSVPEIIKKVLDEANITEEHYQLKLTGNYQSRVYTLQYNESEYDFLCRLMEEEGIHYHFEHSEDKHVMIMGDAKPVFQKIPLEELEYHPRSGLMAETDVSFTFWSQEKTVPGKVVTRDYNFEKPKMTLEVEQAGEKLSELQQFYFPGNYTEQAEGQRYAKIKTEAHEAQRYSVGGVSNSCRLIPGYLFALTSYEREEFNKEYLVKKVSHTGYQTQSLDSASGDQGSSYSNEYFAIVADTPFRPKGEQPLVIPIDGTQTAFVTGPSGEEIYTDEHGRIKVQFHWDREGQQDEKTSCWIRVNQDWAGGEWGAFKLPRIGHEVIIDYIDGDPNRPLVMGSVYNGESMPPYDLPEHKTRSTTKTNSSLGGEGFNEIRFEDKKGQEQVFIHAEKDMDIRVKNDRRDHVEVDRHLIVEKDRFEYIKADSHHQVNVSQFNKVAQKVSETIGQSRQLKVGNNYLEEAGSEVHFKSGQKTVLDAAMELTVKAGGSFIKFDPSGVTLSGPTVSLNSGGSPGKGTNASPDAPTTAVEADKDISGQKFTPTPPPAPAENQGIQFASMAQQIALADAMTNAKALVQNCKLKA